MFSTNECRRGILCSSFAPGTLGGKGVAATGGWLGCGPESNILIVSPGNEGAGKNTEEDSIRFFPLHERHFGTVFVERSANLCPTNAEGWTMIWRSIAFPDRMESLSYGETNNSMKKSFLHGTIGIGERLPDAC